MLNIFMLLLLGANSGVVFADCAGAAKSGDFALARSLCPPVADQQPPDVSWLIGYWYERGEGGPVDYRKAAFWYKKAADRGSSAGKVDLGKLHLRNKGGLTDFKAGIELVKGEIRVGKNNSKEYELLYNALLFGEPGTGKYVDYDEAIRYGRLLLKTNPETEKVLQDQMRIKLSIAALLASGKVKDADGARQARAIFKEVAEWQIAKLGSGQGRIYCDSQCNLLLKYWVIALEKGLGASPAPDAARQFYEKYTIQTDSLLNTRYQGQGKRSNWQLYEQLLRPARSFIPLDVVRKELNAPDSTQLVLFPTKSWTGIDSAFDLTVFSGYDWRLEDLETIINNANQVVASCGIGIRRATIFQGRFDGLSDPDSFYTAEHDVWSNQYRFPAKGVGATAIFSNTEKTTDGGWSKQNRHDPQEIHLAVINHKESDDAINDFDLAHELGHLLGDFGHSDDFTPSVMQYIPSIRNFRFLPEQCEKIRVHPDVYPIARGWAPPATPSNVPHEIVNELALWPIGKTTLTESLGGRDRKSADTLAKTIKSYVMTSGDLRPLTYLKDYYLPESPRVAVFYDILGRMTTETRGAIQGPVLEGIAKEYFLGTGDVLQIVAQARAWQPDYGWPTEKILANKEGWANVPAIALLRFEETDSSDYFKVDARGCNPLLNYEDPDDVKKSFTSSLIRYVRGCSSRQSFEIRKMQNVLSELENRSQLGLWYGLGFKRAYQMYCQGAQRGSEEARNMVSRT
jgi:TPR repeat protein